MSEMIEYDHGIYAVDANYFKSGVAAIHLLVEGDRAAIIDTGVNASVPSVLGALRHLNLEPEQVDCIILTHIHLDHAGGAGELMRQLPNARLVVHPRGSRHMADPTRLIAGTEAVYGAERTAELYGTILPIDPSRMVEARPDQIISLNGRTLRLLDTPGHALHHICIVDEKSGHIFSGDTFGISYRQLDRDGRQFIFATTTPVQFDPVALHASIDLLSSFQPDAIYLTHFSQVRDIPRLAHDLKTCVDAHAAIALRAGGGPSRETAIADGLKEWVAHTSTEQAWGLQGDDAVKLLRMDINLNAQGLGVWLDRQAQQKR